MNTQNKLLDTENKLMVARREWVVGTGGKGKRILKYKLVLTKYSWRCEEQHRKYSQ